MIKEKKYKGYYLYNLYDYLWRYIFFSPRYKYINHKLLKRFVVYQYKKVLRGNDVINN